MKLLFDHNLSPKLPRLLADVYAGSLHVREAGLLEAEDSAVWDYARLHGLVIVSKSKDLFMSGHSPREVTQPLKAWRGGDQAALNKLILLIHNELHRLAHIYWCTSICCANAKVIRFKLPHC